MTLPSQTPRPFTVTNTLVLRISIPMMLAYVSTPLVGMVNIGVVGQLGSADLIGGVAIATVIFDVLLATFNFLRGGTAGMTAQAVGAGDAIEEAAVLLRAVVFAMAIGLGVLALKLPLEAMSFALFSISPDVADAGRDYFGIRAWSAPLLLFNFAVLGWLLGRGDAFSSMALQTLVNVVNAALALWLVIELGWGVAGAAWAAVAAEFVTACAGAAVVAWKLSGRALPDRARVFNTGDFRHLTTVNADMAVRSLALLAGMSFFTHQSAVLGTVALAANTILLRIYVFTSATLDGFATAAEQLAGRATGARFRPAFEHTVSLTARWSIGVALVLSATIWLVGPYAILAMTSSEEVRAAAMNYLGWCAVLPLAGVIAFQMDGIFLGAMWSRDMRNMMILSLAIFAAAWAALMPVFGNEGLWAAFLIFHAARSISFHWRMKRLVVRTFGAPQP